jgi:hypothetical protein
MFVVRIKLVSLKKEKKIHPSKRASENILAQNEKYKKKKKNFGHQEEVEKCPWVFTVKYSYNEEKEEAKARLVAHGFQDRTPYSLEETYSPVINSTSIVICWIIAFTNRYNLNLFALDVKTAWRS